MMTNPPILKTKVIIIDTVEKEDIIKWYPTDIPDCPIIYFNPTTKLKSVEICKFLSNCDFLIVYISLHGAYDINTWNFQIDGSMSLDKFGSHLVETIGHIPTFIVALTCKGLLLHKWTRDLPNDSTLVTFVDVLDNWRIKIHNSDNYKLIRETLFSPMTFIGIMLMDQKMFSNNILLFISKKQANGILSCKYWDFNNYKDPLVTFHKYNILRLWLHSSTCLDARINKFFDDNFSAISAHTNKNEIKKLLFQWIFKIKNPFHQYIIAMLKGFFKFTNYEQQTKTFDKMLDTITRWLAEHEFYLLFFEPGFDDLINPQRLYNQVIIQDDHSPNIENKYMDLLEEITLYVNEEEISLIQIETQNYTEKQMIDYYENNIPQLLLHFALSRKKDEK